MVREITSIEILFPATCPDLHCGASIIMIGRTQGVLRLEFVMT